MSILSVRKDNHQTVLGEEGLREGEGIEGTGGKVMIDGIRFERNEWYEYPYILRTPRISYVLTKQDLIDLIKNAQEVLG